MTEPPVRSGLISRVTRAAVDHPARFLLAALLVAAVSVKLASGLEIRSSFEELLPEDVPSVREIKDLVKRVGGDGTILVVVESLEGEQGLRKAEALGDQLTKEILALEPKQIRSVQSSMAPIRDWFENHWPLFVPLADLRKARDSVRDEIKKQKAKANIFALDDDDAPKQLAAATPEFLDLSKPAPKARVAERFVNARLRIVIADDERPARAFLARLLAQCGDVELAGEATKGTGAPDAAFFTAIAEGMHTAYQERLKTLGDKPSNTCTTHFCAADSEGNMVALTQTLMSLFGSCVMLPKTGITMNNGMLWFDPEPNRPNSIAPAKRPLCNICPVVVVKDGKPWFCIGASGGRRIVPAVTQLSLMLIDRGLDVEAAFHQPRVDVSGVGPIRVNRELSDTVKKAIAAKLPIVEVTNQISPLGFANPSCIVRDPATGMLTGMNEVMSPWAGGATQ